MNFNRSNKADYALKSRNINEMINLYGVEIDFLYTEKMNVDRVLGDYSYLKVGENESRKITVLPDNTEEFDGDIEMGMYGSYNARTTELYISRPEILRIYPDFDDSKGWNGIVGQLLVLPSGKIMEISDFDDQVPGQNNLWTSKDQKSVYMLTCIPYSNSKQNELDEEPLEEITEQDKSIDDYFDDLEIEQEAIDIEAKEISSTDSVFGSLG